MPCRSWNDPGELPRHLIGCLIAQDVSQFGLLSDLIGTRTLPLMAGDVNGELRGFVERWRVAGARLAALRRSELRDVEVADHIDALNGAFEATLAGPVRTTSGLVQQQAMFARIRDARPLSPGE